MCKRGREPLPRGARLRLGRDRRPRRACGALVLAVPCVSTGGSDANLLGPYINSCGAYRRLREHRRQGRPSPAQPADESVPQTCSHRLSQSPTAHASVLGPLGSASREPRKRRPFGGFSLCLGQRVAALAAASRGFAAGSAFTASPASRRVQPLGLGHAAERKAVAARLRGGFSRLAASASGLRAWRRVCGPQLLRRWARSV